MLIVTTSLEELWGSDEDIIFLGEWCKLYNRKKIWLNRKNITLPDPWSNRNRRIAAYKYTEKLFEYLIITLSTYLNKVHNLDYPVKYWKILCGPWLRLFINSTYHKWECVNDVVSCFNSVESNVYKFEPRDYVPANMEDFETKMVSDEWNCYISELVMNEIGVLTRAVSDNRNKNSIQDLKVFERTSTIKNYAIKFYGYMLKILNKNASVIVQQPYISKYLILKLAIRLRALPYIKTPLINNKINYDSSLRNSLVNLEEREGSFEFFLHKIIMQHIPTAYLEDFKLLNKLAKSNNWPEKPKSVLTAVSHWSDDLFKCNMANKFLLGSKLNIICHGGGGKMKYSDFQSFDFQVSDNYFTWGWSAYSRECVKGFFVKKEMNKRSKSNLKSSLLHITLTQFRYTKFISSTPSYEQFIGGYINDQIYFINTLSKEIKKCTITKLHYDYQNCIDSRILEEIPDQKFATIDNNYLKLLNKARLVVCTYNCTTFVESIAYNIPTLVFWNPEHWELEASAIPLFETLSACGIFHENPESAALMANKIWHDIDAWWNSEKVINACNAFTSWFCRESDCPIDELVTFIRY